MTEATARREDDAVTGFGGFVRIEQPTRIGHNPRFGQRIAIGLSAAMSFNAGKALREAEGRLRPRCFGGSAKTPRDYTSCRTCAASLPAMRMAGERRPDGADRGEIENPGRIPGGRGGSGVYEATLEERMPEIKNFSYANDPLDDLDASLSSKRLGAFLQIAGGDQPVAGT